MWLTARAPVTEEVQGRGPISILSWEDTERLNAVGSWRASVPAANLRARDDILMRGTVECWAIVAGHAQVVAKGIVMERNKHARGDESIVEFSGPTMGEELNYTLVHDLELTDPILLHPETALHHFQIWWGTGLVWVDVRLDEALDDDPNNSTYINNMLGSPAGEAGYLYFGHEELFYEIEFMFDPSDYNQTEGIYWRAQIFNGGGWVEITIEDTTINEGRTFHQRGSFTWDEGHAWAKTLHNEQSLYWIRCWPSADMDDFKLREIRVWSKGAKTQDVAAVLEYSDPVWTVSEPDSRTQNGTFLQFSGETVLGALNKVAEEAGEFFRLTKDRQVVWLGNSARDIGVMLTRGRGSVQTNIAKVVFISDIEQIEDSWDVVTQIYPYGAGNGPARLTMEESDIVIPPLPAPLVSFNKEENYLRAISGFNEYGLIEREMTFNEVQVIREDDLGRTSAANQLFWAAYFWLLAHAAPVTSYRVTVVDGNTIFAPGDYVRLNFVDFDAGGFRTFDARGDWTVTEVTQSFDGNGVRSTKLVLTNNVLRRVMYSGKTVIHRLEQALKLQTVRQPFPKDNVAPPVRTNVKPVITGGKASAWEISITEALANHLQIVVDATE